MATKDEKKAMIDNLQRSKEKYEKSEGMVDKYLISHVKNRLFSCYDGTAMSKLPPSQRYRLNIETFHFIVTEVYKLSPKQLDAIWSYEVLVHMNLSSLVKEIDEDAPDEVKEATLFNRRFIILHECFPEYYRSTYPERYDVRDVIDASGATLKRLCKAGRVDTKKISAICSKDENSKKAKGGSRNSGEIVDKIAYNALNVFLKTALKTDDIKEHLTALAYPKLLKLKSLGVSKVIISRGCWSSLLDFYYLNSPPAIQTMFLKDYCKLREETQEYDAISAFLDEI